MFTDSNNSGGGNMKDYVTHEELDHAVDKLSSKIELSEAHIDTKLAEISINVKHMTTIIWWVFGILISGITIPLLMAAIKFIFLNK